MSCISPSPGYLQGDTFSISPVFLDQSHENEKVSSRFLGAYMGDSYGKVPQKRESNCPYPRTRTWECQPRKRYCRYSAPRTWRRRCRRRPPGSRAATPALARTRQTSALRALPPAIGARLASQIAWQHSELARSAAPRQSRAAASGSRGAAAMHAARAGRARSRRDVHFLNLVPEKKRRNSKYSCTRCCTY
eukprot:SAG31_NODE_7869_length_1578_cov_1.362407_1_plen_191_part_00